MQRLLVDCYSLIVNISSIHFFLMELFQNDIHGFLFWILYRKESEVAKDEVRLDNLLTQ